MNTSKKEKKKKRRGRNTKKNIESLKRNKEGCIRFTNVQGDAPVVEGRWALILSIPQGQWESILLGEKPVKPPDAIGLCIRL
jgi:hypothetical protein